MLFECEWCGSLNEAVMQNGQPRTKCENCGGYRTKASRTIPAPVDDTHTPYYNPFLPNWITAGTSAGYVYTVMNEGISSAQSNACSMGGTIMPASATDKRKPLWT